MAADTIELMHSNADYSWPDNDTEFTSGNYHSTINRSTDRSAQSGTDVPAAQLAVNPRRSGLCVWLTGKEGWRLKASRMKPSM